MYITRILLRAVVNMQKAYSFLLPSMLPNFRKRFQHLRAVLAEHILYMYINQLIKLILYGL